ncbi:hypothetical protein Syun_003644 [Stephania yunnanensis]|uniref:Pectin acetylesterase n=1 Tax=Stephania yunnanensis TaxID=152371 RepID=A0AAP0Q007_9MAGN
MKISIKYSTDVLVPYHPVVNLTMIDLPGLTKVVVGKFYCFAIVGMLKSEGQPDSILQEIENMVRSFIEKVYTLCIALKGILAFTAFWYSATFGERTFGVLTKIDLMDKGTNAVDSVTLSVGDWFFDRVEVSAIDCPYPCDNTCHNLVSK